jgi:excisionase family DNA binding protein
MTPQLDKDYQTTKEAADYLGVKPQYIHKLFNDGKLTGWRGQGITGRLHISSVSIEKFIESNGTKIHLEATR